MGHTVKEKGKLLNRVRRIRGQVDAVERALQSEEGCSEVLQLITATRGAINGLMAEVLEEHVRTHVLAPDIDRRSSHSKAADELLGVVRAYLK